MLKQMAVTGLSLFLVLASGAVTYASWLAMAGVPALVRGLASLLVWVAGFAIGTSLFWRSVVRLFGR